MQFLTESLPYIKSAVLIMLFFGGSIFVHELGHFLAARKRGLKITRFSIGMGPRLFGWRGKDGVDYRISLLPIGGYVALPQLADMRAIEGDEKTDNDDTPPPSYSTRMIVLVAGAVFNVIFAFLLATLLWGVGQPATQEDQTTEIGYVVPSYSLKEGQTQPGPAFVAGLQPGDIVRKVDGSEVSKFSDIDYLVAIGAGRDKQDNPSVTLTIERNGQTKDVTIEPIYQGVDQTRTIGIEPAMEPMIGQVLKDSAAEEAGLQQGDVITAIDGNPAGYVSFVSDYLLKKGAQPVTITYERDGQSLQTTLTPRMVKDEQTGREVPRLGVQLGGKVSVTLLHVAPWSQIADHAIRTWRTVESLVNPASDIGPSKLSGPVGIARVYHLTAQTDIRLVIWFTILLNVNLAIFNLLPIPVLDGGHMVFATINKLRGKPLPASLIANIQGAFMVLLLAMLLYVSTFDVRRIWMD